jgi:hypothetical protein
MKHPSEEELVLHYYEECDQPEWLREHLRQCDQCREVFEEISQVLELTANSPAPERDASYAAAVWSRLAPKLPEPAPAKRWFRWPNMALAAAAVAVALVIFQPHPEAPAPVEQATAVNRGAVLRMEVASHLEESERFLLEVMNSEDSHHTEWAEDLLHSNRLLRQTAATRDMEDMGGVLEELELALTEAAHPDGGGPAEHFDGPEILFRVRAVGARLSDQEVIYANAF